MAITAAELTRLQEQQVPPDFATWEQTDITGAVTRPPATIDGIDVTDTVVRVAVLAAGDASPIFIPYTGLTWEEPANAWAGTVKVTVPDADTDQGPMADLAALGTPLLIYSSEAHSDFEEVWRGIIKANPRQSTSGSMTLTAYEVHSALLDSDADFTIKTDETAQAAIERLCNLYNITLSKIDGPSCTLSTAQVLRGKKLAEVFSAIFDQTQEQGGGLWLVRSYTGSLEVVEYGKNTEVWYFAANQSSIDSSLEGDISGLVTKVRNMSQAADDESSATISEISGLTDFGDGITRLVYTEGEGSDEATELKAAHILATDGFPKWTRKADAPLLMRLRKGDKVRWHDRLLDGYFICMGVSKSITARTMSLELSTQEDIERTTAAIQIQSALDAIQPPKPESTTGGTTGGTGVKGGDALARLRNAAAPVLGTPYAWGGPGGRSDFDPNECQSDCSGFQAWLAHQFGVQLPAFTDSIAGATTLVATNSQEGAQVGDYILYKGGSQPGAQYDHVAMWIGPNKTLEDGGMTRSTLGFSGIGEATMIPSSQYEIRRSSAMTAALSK